MALGGACLDNERRASGAGRENMAVKIRLARHGVTKRPFYRIVITDIESPRDGKFIEIVGTYDPKTDPATVALKTERVRHWLEKGATPTDTVRSLLKKQGLLGAAPAPEAGEKAAGAA